METINEMVYEYRHLFIFIWSLFFILLGLFTIWFIPVAYGYDGGVDLTPIIESGRFEFEYIQAEWILNLQIVMTGFNLILYVITSLMFWSGLKNKST